LMVRQICKGGMVKREKVVNGDRKKKKMGVRKIDGNISRGEVDDNKCIQNKR